MNTHIDFEMPTQAEIDKMIQQGRQMRSEYLANSVKAGLSKLRGVFTNKKGRVAQINLSAERALPKTDFMRCVRNWGGQVRSSG